MSQEKVFWKRGATETGDIWPPFCGTQSVLSEGTLLLGQMRSLGSDCRAEHCLIDSWLLAVSDRECL